LLQRPICHDTPDYLCCKQSYATPSFYASLILSISHFFSSPELSTFLRRGGCNDLTFYLHTLYTFAFVCFASSLHFSSVFACIYGFSLWNLMHVHSMSHTRAQRQSISRYLCFCSLACWLCRSLLHTRILFHSCILVVVTKVHNC
jgi:hypothetical protein